MVMVAVDGANAGDWEELGWPCGIMWSWHLRGAEWPGPGAPTGQSPVGLTAPAATVSARWHLRLRGAHLVMACSGAPASHPSRPDAAAAGSRPWRQAPGRAARGSR